MTTKRILVGVMHCIENEFFQCIEAIRNQTYANYEYFVVKGLPNKVAHDTLYKRFMESANDFDYFIKIDADMVLCRNTFFEEVISQMEIEVHKNHFQIGVWDFFTERLVYALHVYRSDVKWGVNNENLFVDMVNVPTRCKNFMNLSGPLAPAANHCPNPSPFQSFHFGVHKAAKLTQVDMPKKKKDSAYTHARNIYFLWRNYYNNHSTTLRFAMAGVLWGIKESVGVGEIDFSSSKTKDAFAYFKIMPLETLERIVEEQTKELKLNFPENLWVIYSYHRYTLRKSELMSVFFAYRVIILNLLRRIRTKISYESNSKGNNE